MAIINIPIGWTEQRAIRGKGKIDILEALPKCRKCSSLPPSWIRAHGAPSLPATASRGTSSNESVHPHHLVRPRNRTIGFTYDKRPANSIIKLTKNPRNLRARFRYPQKELRSSCNFRRVTAISVHARHCIVISLTSTRSILWRCVGLKFTFFFIP